jgi:hypothetical protein
MYVVKFAHNQIQGAEISEGMHVSTLRHDFSGIVVGITKSEQGANFRKVALRHFKAGTIEQVTIGVNAPLWQLTEQTEI